MFGKLGRTIVLLLIITALIIHYQPQVLPFLEGLISNVQPTEIVTPAVQAQTTKPDHLIQRHFNWQAVGKRWSWQITLSQSACEYFKGLPRIQTDDYSVYVTNPDDDEYLNELIQKFRQARTQSGLSEHEMVAMVVSFVQSIPYVEDKVSTGQDEYPRYPLETLYDQQGDCEDKSILMASLLDKLGYGVVLLELPDHMAVGVKGEKSLPGDYITYQGSRYYYLETTEKNWQIGDAPSKMLNSKVRIRPLIPKAVLTHQWQSKGSILNYQVTVTVFNQGTAPAANTKVQAMFDAGGSKVYSQNTSGTVSIPPGGKATFTVKLRYPHLVKTRIHVQVIANGVLDGESTSEWFTAK
ncbi:MAG: hypothetical protein ACM3NT_11790 [Methylocystaceae bacterium]